MLALMDVRFLTPAVKELDEAFVYYQSIVDGLGYEFVSEVEHSITRIKHFPTAYPLIGSQSRRCLIHRFPYGLIYQERNEEILIIAISNLHRKPKYWVSREL
ncbi:MAG TPA: plasmid stabilization protein [Oceanospirillaceae bacterium]|nr:plasmid stabilization protein [Oceanospirillaceae bacterium]